MSDLVSILKTISQRRLIDESKKLTKLNELENVIKFFKSSPWKQIVKNDTSEKKTFAHSIAISYLKSVLGEDKFAFVDTELDFSGKKKLVVLHDKGGIIEKLSHSARSKLEKYEFSNFKNRNKGYISAKPKTVDDPEDTSNHSQGLENEVLGASQPGSGDEDDEQDKPEVLGASQPPDDEYEDHDRHKDDDDEHERPEPERPEPEVLGASHPPDDDDDPVDPVYHNKDDDEHEVTGASQEDEEMVDEMEEDEMEEEEIEEEEEGGTLDASQEDEAEEMEDEIEDEIEEMEDEIEEMEGTLGDSTAYIPVGASGFVYRFPGVNTVKTNFSDEVNNKISFSSSYDTNNYSVGDTVTFDAYRFTSTSLTDTTGEILNFSLYYGESTNKTETYVLVIPPITTPITLTYNFYIEGEGDYSGDNFGHGDQNIITVNGNEVTLSLDNFTSSGGNLLLNTKRN